jgi:hypothetical protein
MIISAGKTSKKATMGELFFNGHNCCIVLNGKLNLFDALSSIALCSKKT